MRSGFAVVAAGALAVAGAVWLPLADFWFFSLGSSEELARAELRIAPDYDGWPFYTAGGGVIAGLAALAAVRDLGARLTVLILAIAWLWFSAAGLSLVLAAPAGIHPSAGECRGLPPDPAGYWGSESWRNISPAYEAAAARAPRGSICWDRDDGPAIAATLLASFLGLTGVGLAAAALRRWRHRFAVALALALPPVVAWAAAALFEALSVLE